MERDLRFLFVFSSTVLFVAVFIASVRICKLEYQVQSLSSQVQESSEWQRQHELHHDVPPMKPRLEVPGKNLGEIVFPEAKPMAVSRPKNESKKPDWWASHSFPPAGRR